MGTLARYLVEAIRERPRAGWSFHAEHRVFGEELASRLGVNPSADLMLRTPDGRRVIVELEISRADPVTNQVKYLVAVQAGALRPDDVLVSMFSAHVAAGRRNLSAAFVRHLRVEGYAAFQLSLLPHTGAEEIARLNRMPPGQLAQEDLPTSAERARILSVVLPRGDREHRIHFAGDCADVVANLWAWNDAMAGPEAARWASRPIQYFVHDPVSTAFAPSKFCAFVPAARPGGPKPPPTMTLGVYLQLGEQDPRFDGNRAWRHLVRSLAFEKLALAAQPTVLRERFAAWARAHQAHLSVREPVQVLLPPAWYAR